MVTVSVLGTACLEDLEEPLECVPPPERPGAATSCLTAVAEAATPFDERACVSDPELLSCYRDPAATCSCERDCEDTSPACHPAPDCPAEVLERYPTAQCFQFDPEDIGPFQSGEEQCLCGCETCLRTCDGKGPIWTQIDFLDPNTGELATPAGVLTLETQRHFPERGRGGVYVRARGLTASVGQDEATEAPGVLAFGESLEQVTVMGQLPGLMSDRFDEALFPADDLLEWSDASNRPSLVAFNNAAQAYSLYEIDCVIPFVVP